MNFEVQVTGLSALVAKLKEAPAIAAPILQRALAASQAILAKHTVKGIVPWRTGFLTQSFRAELTTGMLKWSPTASYACVFDGHTRVLTDQGIKEISTIRPGDRVLTQDGQYHAVNSASRFPATEKPNLVDIEIGYRAGSAHKLTVTQDHKVLAYRGGRNKWVPAGELFPTDMLFGRIKKAHNKGTGRKYICINCERSHQGQGEAFCSVPCRDEYWRKHGNPNIGSRRSLASRARMATAAQRRFTLHPETHPNHLYGKADHKTEIERQVEAWLRDLGVTYEYQKQIGKYWADFYVPAWDTIFECDGAFWHQDQTQDVERDKAIFQTMPGVHIIHIHFFDERHSPHLTPKPYRHVSYVAVNPNINSYVDLDEFSPKRIVSIRKWIYERARGHRSAPLYDISVEGMHSFVANGVVVSNSFVEFGTAPHVILPKEKKALYWPGAAHPVARVNHPGSKANDFMGRILEASQPEIDATFMTALRLITEGIAST